MLRRQRYEYPMPIPPLEPESPERETAINFLINYLTQKRGDLLKLPESTEPAVINQHADLSETIDTTLLKCYLETNPALVGPLLRVYVFFFF